MIEISDATIRAGDFELSRLELLVECGEYAILMGPTGCGKTTVMEAICGLRKLRSGRIVIDGRDVTHIDASQRDIGYVPQDRALFPAMRIDKQIEFGLRVRRANSVVRRQRVEELAELTGITQLLLRFPKGLSGGQTQRVALARALSFRPRLLCLDEPLSALDEKTSEHIADLLKTIHQREKVTVLHVTHDSQEASRLGTRHFRFEGKQIKRENVICSESMQRL